MNKLIVVFKYKKPSPFNLYKKKKFTFKFDCEDEIERNVGLVDIKFKLSDLGTLQYSISFAGNTERNDILECNDTEYYIPNVTDLCCIYSIKFKASGRKKCIL